MNSTSISLNVSQQTIDQIVLESSNQLHILGLPLEDILKERIKNLIPTFHSAIDGKKLKALLKECNCNWE